MVITPKTKKKPHSAVWRGRLVMALALLIGWMPLGGLPGTALAAGDASFSLSPPSGSYTVGDSFTLTVSETSSAGDGTNAVQVNLSYPSSLLQYQSTSLSGPFTLCGQNTGGGGAVNIGCAATSAQSGTQSVARISFSVIAAGSASVAMTSGSDIVNGSGTSVWNGTLPSASYTLASPAPPAGGGGSSGSGSTGGTSSGSSGSSGSTSSGTSTKTSSPTSTAAPTPTPTTPTPAAPVTTAAPMTAIKPPLGTLTITVTDSHGKPINKAKVTIDKTTVGYTNASGMVTFQKLQTGKHSVTVSSSGKKTATTQLTVTSDQAKLASVKLSPAFGLVPLIIIVVVLLLLAGSAAYWFLLRRKSNKPSTPASDPISPVVVTGSAPNPPSSGTNMVPPTVIQPQSPPAASPPAAQNQRSSDNFR